MRLSGSYDRTSTETRRILRIREIIFSSPFDIALIKVVFIRVFLTIYTTETKNVPTIQYTFIFTILDCSVLEAIP